MPAHIIYVETGNGNFQVWHAAIDDESDAIEAIRAINGEGPETYKVVGTLNPSYAATIPAGKVQRWLPQ